MLNTVRKLMKAPASAITVPQNRDQANELLSRIGVAQRQRTRIEADMNDAIAKIKEEFVARAIPVSEEISANTKALQHWCEANRENLTEHGKFKTSKLAAGEVGWRMRPPKVTLKDVAKVIERIKEKGLLDFLRVKEDVNKETMLADPETALSIKGVSITQGEDFFVRPFETELEEVV